MNKICFKCHKEKDINEFHKNKRNKDGYKGICKECCRLYVDEHIEEKRQYEKEHKYKEVRNRATIKYRENNRDKLAGDRKSPNYIMRQREWRNKNRDRLKARRREYYYNNKSKWKYDASAVNQRKRERYANELDYNIIKKLRSRFTKAIRGERKEESVLEIIGCTLDEFKNHIGSLFSDGMTWDLLNRGEIHIDHILPVKAFSMRNPIHQKACFYWGNFQPLWKGDNLRKRSSYSIDDFNNYMDWYINNVYKK